MAALSKADPAVERALHLYALLLAATTDGAALSISRRIMRWLDSGITKRQERDYYAGADQLRRSWRPPRRHPTRLQKRGRR